MTITRTRLTTVDPDLLDPDELARALADDGIDAHEDAVARFVARARRRAIRGPALDALADTSRSPILRARAFDHVRAALVAPPAARTVAGTAA